MHSLMNKPSLLNDLLQGTGILETSPLPAVSGRGVVQNQHQTTRLPGCGVKYGFWSARTRNGSE